MIHLNQAGTSWPKPGPVVEAVGDALVAPPQSWAKRFTAQHREIAGVLGVSDPRRLLLTPGATSALSAAVLDLPWQTGDRVVTSGLEHHALDRPVQQLAAWGVERVVVPPGDGRAFGLDVLRDVLRGGRVRLVATTAACNVTGDRLPVEEVVALAHEHDALVLVDAAQIAGWLAIDVEALGVDLLAFTGHKGPQGPWGIGGLYVADRVVMASPAATCQIPSTSEDSPAPCAPMPGYCDVGSVDRAALAGLVAGFRWLAEPSRADRLARARRQTAFVEATLADIDHVLLHAWSPATERMPVVAFTSSRLAPAEIARALEERGCLVAGGLQCAPLAHETLGTAPDGVVRISFGPGNADADGEAVVENLREVLAP